MATDKNGTPLEHFDIVYVDPNQGMPLLRTYYALVIRDQYGNLMKCSYSGLSQIESEFTEKVGHFPSAKFHLPKDVEREYIKYLKKLRNSIDEQMLHFVETSVRAKSGVIDG